MEHKGLFEMGFETKQLIDILLPTKIGELVPYQKMSAALGFDIRQRRGILESARSYLLRENGYVFDTVRNEGIRRMSDPDKVGILHGVLDHVGRVIHRTKKAMTTIDYQQLDPEKKIDFNTGTTLLAFAEQATKKKNYDRAHLAIANANAVLPLGDTVKLFEK